MHMQTALLIGRVVFSLYFIKSGLMHFLRYKAMVDYSKYKKIPAAGLAVPVTGLMMLLGGVGVLLNMYIVISYGLIIAFLAPTAFLMHDFWTETDATARMNSRINFEKNIAIAAAALMLMFC